MTIHSPHPDTHTHGLHDGCARCAELAEQPFHGLGNDNLSRIVRLALDPDERFSASTSELDQLATVQVLNVLERVGHLARVAPLEVAVFLSRYGVDCTIVPRPFL